MHKLRLNIKIIYTKKTIRVTKYKQCYIITRQFSIIIIFFTKPIEDSFYIRSIISIYIKSKEFKFLKYLNYRQIKLIRLLPRLE